MRKTVSTPISLTLIEDGQSAPFYTLEYFAWSNVERTNTTTTSPFTEPYAGWSDVIPENTSGLAYLWCKVITYTWNETTRQYDAGTPQYYRKTGTDGTSIKIQGTIAQAYASGTDMTSSFYVGDIQGTYAIRQGDDQIYVAIGVASGVVTYEALRDGGGELVKAADGDAYTVSMNCTVDLGDGNGAVNVKGCLLQWSGEASRWINLGLFQGQSGKTYFTHIAWADSVTLSSSTLPTPAGQTNKPNATAVTGGSIVPTSQSKPWMGYLINETVADSQVYTNYTWSEVKGKNGVAVSVDRNTFNVNNDIDGHVSSAQDLGSMVVKYMDGQTALAPEIYHNGTRVTSNGIQLEKNLYIFTPNGSTDHIDIALYTTAASGNNRLDLSSGHKSYTLTAVRTGYPNINFVITINGNSPQVKYTQKTYLALSSSNADEVDVKFGMKPSAISGIYWSIDIPLGNNDQPFIWERTRSEYTNGEETVELKLIADRGQDCVSIAKDNFVFATNPNDLLLSVGSIKKRTAIQLLNSSGAAQQIKSLTIFADAAANNIPQSISALGFGFTTKIVGGETPTGWQALPSPITLDMGMVPSVADISSLNYKSVTIEFKPTPLQRLWYVTKSGSTQYSSNLVLKVMLKDMNNNSLEGSINIDTAEEDRYDPIDVGLLTRGSNFTSIAFGTNQGIKSAELYGVLSGTKVPIMLQVIQSARPEDPYNAYLIWEHINISGQSFTKYVSTIKIEDNQTTQIGRYSLSLQ